MKKRALLVAAAMLCGVMVTDARPATVSTPKQSRTQRLAAAGTTPVFGNPVIAGVQGWGFEPDLRIDSEDRLYTSSPNSLGSVSWLWRSLDHGKTFKWVPAASPLLGKLPICAGGGDTELAVDSADNLYWNDLSLVNFSTARTEDQGATFTPPNCTSTETTPNDRQWYATDGDPTNGGDLYLTYNIVAGSPPPCVPAIGPDTVGQNILVVARSPAGGAGPDAGVHFAPSEIVTSPPTGTGCDEAIMGNIEVSPTSHKIFVIHDNATLDAIRIGVCERVPFTTRPSGLTCEDHLVAEFPGFKTGANFPTMAIDTEGNLYAVWEQAPIDENGMVTGDTLLYYSVSKESEPGDGEVWTDPIQIPTPGLHNNVFAWIVAGDPGRVAIAWYGTEALSGTSNTCGATPPHDPIGGPDTAHGLWNVYYTQTLNGLSDDPFFFPRVDPVGHHIHKGTMFTLIGGQCGSRSLGDFFQLRAGLNGEANIIYGDSTNRFGGSLLTHNMFVRQSGGIGLYAAHTLRPEPYRFGGSSDPSGDATYDADGMTSASQPNLDILSTDITRPDADHYRISMTVADLTDLAPDPTTGNTDTDLVWQTQWFVPSSTNPEGGKNFFVYMEKSATAECPTFWDGENGFTLDGGGAALTYPGENQIVGSYTPTAPGTIWIDVPIANVTVPEGGVGPGLHEITANTQTAPAPPQENHFSGVGGTLFNLIDVAPSYTWPIPGTFSGAPSLNPDPCGVQTGPAPTPSSSTSSGGSPSPSPSPTQPGFCTQTGTSGDDELEGTNGRDVICGLGGNDIINGLGGNDILIGGSGRDVLIGGRGADRLKGRSGSDDLRGRRGHDRLKGNRAPDALGGGPGDDVLLGGPGRDACAGGPGKDKTDSC